MPASEVKQQASQQQAVAQPPKSEMKPAAARTTRPASEFSNLLTVDNIRVSEMFKDSLAYVTVRVHTKMKRIKCAVIERNRYLGVGYDYNVSPPAAQVLVTLPGKDHGGSWLKAECSQD